MDNKSEKADNLTTTSEKVNAKVKTPKNVRQIGKIGDGLRIYVEDYVKTYTRQLAESDYTSRSIAVLIGEFRNTDTERNVFLYGAIKVDVEDDQEVNAFTEDTWAIIYEKIKVYFPDAEIVGWYYGGTGFGPEDLEVLEQIQVNNFPGRDKVLLIYDILEKENSFYLFDGISMVLQTGYYIYYEKNTEMQSYMVDHKKVKKEEEGIVDQATIKMRTILSEKKPVKKDSEQKFIMRLGYTAAGMVMVVGVIVATTLIGNNQRIKELEGDILTMKRNIFEKSPEDIVTASPDEKKDIVTRGPDSVVVTISPTGIPIEFTPTVAVATPTKAADPTIEPVVTPTNVPTQEPTQEPVMTFDPQNLVEYTVKAGDTLASICVRECGSYGYLSALKDLNQIEDENVIYVGQVILIPKQ